MHIVKGSINLFEGHGVGDQFIQFDLTAHILIDHPGQLGSAFHPAKGCAAPDPAGDQLKGSSADFLAGTGNADNNGLAPAFMTALEGAAHQIDVAHTLKAVVNAAIGHINNDLGNVGAVFFGVHAIGGAEHLGHLKFAGVGIHRDNSAGFGHHGTLNHREPDAAESKNGDGCA